MKVPQSSISRLARLLVASLDSQRMKGGRDPALTRSLRKIAGKDLLEHGDALLDALCAYCKGSGSLCRSKLDPRSISCATIMQPKLQGPGNAACKDLHCSVTAYTRFITANYKRTDWGWKPEGTITAIPAPSLLALHCVHSSCIGQQAYTTLGEGICALFGGQSCRE